MENRKHARQGLRSCRCRSRPGRGTPRTSVWGRILLKALWARTGMKNPTIVCCPKPAFEGEPRGRSETLWCCHCHVWSSLWEERSWSNQVSDTFCDGAVWDPTLANRISRGFYQVFSAIIPQGERVNRFCDWPRVVAL